MTRFRDLSIRSKLMTGFMLTSLSALLVTLVVLAVYDLATFREQLLADLRVLTGIIGENSTSSLVFNDRETATSTLAALRAQPRIVSARLYDREGRVFATYGAAAPPTAPADGAVVGEKIIAVTRPLTFNDNRVGTLHLQSDTRELTARMNRYLGLALAVLAGAGFVAFVLSSFFQRAISRPILNLLAIEKRVSRDKNYSLQAEKEGDDEVGMLIDGFNEMLSEIRKRDAEIQERHRQEMALAKSIQTSVLPRTFVLPGFDICGVMMPAEEVGGDFYDFRNTPDGSAWLGIGDVTGHGVTSGLIMMMAQSMFTMLCEQRNGQPLSPSRFLSQMNRAMYYNLRSRLDQDRFMTMVVARLERSGKMTFAGAHTDLLVYRAATKTVERIATDGLWLGITDDIEYATSETIVELTPGDVALFHTDGVTEARNSYGDCYDIDRLTRQLSELHNESASMIVTRIANAAWRWAGTPKDDVSLVAVKRS